MGGCFNSKMCGGWVDEGRNQHKNEEVGDLSLTKPLHQLNEKQSTLREKIYGFDKRLWFCTLDRILEQYMHTTRTIA